MKKTPLKKIIAKARAAHRQKKKWHFHMLTPDCVFNSRKKHAFVFENETDSEVFVFYSNKRRMKEGQMLVKMLHGKKILQKAAGKIKVRDRNFEEITKKARELNKKGIHWHHHMLFPNCIFNRHRGKWCIAFEDKEGNKIIESFYEKEPKEMLREIELLYYAQKG